MDRQDTKRLRGSKKRIYQIMAGIMVLICILPLCQANVFASAETGICPHHPAHTDACGYRASADGKSCAHEHSDTCGYTEAGGEDTCGHVHDDVCGYAEAAEEIPCGFVCEICSKADGSADAGIENGQEPGNGDGSGDAGMENGQEPDPGMNDGTGTKPGDGQSPGTGFGDETDVNENGSEEPGDMPEDGSGAPGDESGVPGDEGDTEDRGETGTDPSCAVVSWGWESEYLTLDETTGRWCLGLPGADAENPVTPDVLSEMLPKEITAVLADGTEAVLPLAWDYSALEAPAAVEAGGVYEGSYVLTAALPDPYALAEDAAQISVLVEIGGGEGYADPIDKYVSNWKYVSRGGSEIREITTTQNPTDTYTYTMDYYLSLTSDREEIIGKIKSVLPRQIECDGYYDQNLADAGFDPKEENLSVDGKIHRGYVVIDWTNIEEVFRLAGTLGEGTKLTFYAMPVSNPGYRLRVNSNSPVLSADKSPYENYNDTAERDDILNLTVTIHEIHLTDHIVAGINPPNTTVNLFDYWVDRDGGNPLIKDNTDQERNDLLATTDMHKNTANEPVDRNGVEDWNRGINQGRLLLFGDGNIHAGFWNKGAGAGSGYGAAKAGMPGIIKPVLGTDGYPVMNTPDMKNMLDGYQGILDYQLCGDHIAGSDTLISDSPQNISKTVIANWNNGSASLDYLFDPQTPNQYKRSYENATGLFQLDNNGYYYYDMRQNFAEYNSDSGEFVLYDAPAVDRTDLNPLTGLRSVGNFFPFNTGAQVFDQVDQATGKLSSNASIGSSNLTTTAGYMNHHLGMTVNIDFRQPLEGKINTGSSSNIPMTFQFSGDDDVWIFIDDVLVLDLGGIHSEIYGTIDFSDGTIRVGQSWKTNGFPYNADGTVDLNKLYQDAGTVLTTTLLDQFTAAKKEKTVLWNNNTFASNTSHTLKMFYLERGNYDSSLALRFNLQPMLYQQIAKVDQNGKLVGGVEFDLVPAELTTADAAGAIECLYTDNNAHSSGEFFVRQSENRALVHIVTNADGTTRFLDDEGNYFNFADRGRQYYILKETRTPDGYRSLPIDVVLFYDPSTSMLSVANRWTTGAYACSVANIVGTGGVDYGSFNSGTGEIESDRDPGSGEIL